MLSLSVFYGFPAIMEARRIYLTKGAQVLSSMKKLIALGLCLGLASFCGAQNAPTTQAPDPKNVDSPPAAPPAPLTTPAITGPLQAAPPIVFDAGPLGKLYLDGIVGGMGLWPL